MHGRIVTIGSRSDYFLQEILDDLCAGRVVHARERCDRILAVLSGFFVIAALAIREGQQGLNLPRKGSGLLFPGKEQPPLGSFQRGLIIPHLGQVSALATEETG